MPPKWVANASFLVSAGLFFVASFTGRIRVVTAQPDGLAQVQYPYSGFSFFTILACVGVLLFGITLSFANYRQRATERRRFLGSVLLSGGGLAVIFAVFMSLVNWEDEGPRCLTGCVPSMLSYYQHVFLGSILVSLLGLVAIGSGAYLLIKRRPKTSGLLSQEPTIVS